MSFEIFILKHLPTLPLFSFFCKSLQRKYSISKTFMFMIIYTLLHSFFKVIFLRPDSVSKWVFFICVSFVCLTIFLYFIFKDPLPKVLLTISVSYIILATAEYLVLEWYASQYSTTVNVILDSPGLTKHLSLSITTISAIAFAILTAIWNKNKNRENSRDYWSIVIIMIAQFFSSFILHIGKYYVHSDYNYLDIPLSLQALLFLVIAPILLQEADDYETLKNELTRIRRLNTIADLSYTLFEKRNYEIEKIRHDIKNQLSTISHLIDTGEKQQAYELLIQLKSQVESI
ncbi:MAG: hypothetical protein ACRDBO_11745 [Lachnospiraceae bacterium]